MPILLTWLTISYPLAAHLSIYTGHVGWAADYLALLLALPLICQLALGRRPALWMGACALAAVGIIDASETVTALLIQAQPLIMFSLMFALFASSLRPGSMPLISRFAILIRGDVPEAVIRYGRGATLAWTLFFLAMIAISLTLSLTAPLETWSWFTNCVSYILVGLMFVVEFNVRRWVLKDHVDYSFRQFIRDLMEVDYRRLIGSQRP